MGVSQTRYLLEPLLPGLQQSSSMQQNSLLGCFLLVFGHVVAYFWGLGTDLLPDFSKIPLKYGRGPNRRSPQMLESPRRSSTMILSRTQLQLELELLAGGCEEECSSSPSPWSAGLCHSRLLFWVNARKPFLFFLRV